MSGHLYARDASQIRLRAHELIRQCDAYERNSAHGGEDRIRFGIMLVSAGQLSRAARRAYRRYHREQGWTWPP